MNSRLLHVADGQRTFAIVFDSGDAAMEGLRAFASQERVSAAALTAIGAFERVTLGYFDIVRRDYDRITLDEQVEVLTLTGNIAVSGTEPKVHAHVVVGRADGSAHGGHLIDARVRPTLEVIATELPAHLQRTLDPRTGLHLIDIGRGR